MIRPPPNPPFFPNTTPSQSNTASFKYKDTKADGPTITAHDSNPATLTDATQQETINAAAATKIVFTSGAVTARSEEHTSELQSRSDLACRLLLEPTTTTTVT